MNTGWLAPRTRPRRDHKGQPRMGLVVIGSSEGPGPGGAGKAWKTGAEWKEASLSRPLHDSEKCLVKFCIPGTRLASPHPVPAQWVFVCPFLSCHMILLCLEISPKGLDGSWEGLGSHCQPASSHLLATFPPNGHWNYLSKD